jgi:hypothetical protein
MNRIITISSCKECPFLEIRYNYTVHFYDYICNKMGARYENQNENRVEFVVTNQLKDWFKNLCPLDME